MKKVLTVILDGFGLRKEAHGNAILAANPTHFYNLWNQYPHTTLYASEEYVGLLKNQFGNSEVGHMTIGAGRLIKQNGTLIDEFLERDIDDNKMFLSMIDSVKKSGKTVHIMGLFSPGKVHSDMSHFLKLYDKLLQFGVKTIHFNLITDGRDTKVDSAYQYIKVLEEKIKENDSAVIGSICGRYYAMDRDNNWERTKKYYDLICNGEGIKTENIKSILEQYYQQNITDEFLPPIITDQYHKIDDGDVIIWMNYRNDRARQLIESLVNLNFESFKGNSLKNIKVYSFFPISNRIHTNAFLKANKITNPLGIYLSKLGITQARIAETEKYAHVTFFFDGTYDGKIEGCKKHLIPSPDVPTYDLQPEMSALKVTEQTISCMKEGIDFILVNYANPDMVGHTGNYEATKKAITVVDDCLEKLIESANQNSYKIFLFADHGNADMMLDEKDEKVTTHTLSKVPFVITDTGVELKQSGDLTNIAPTILEYMGLEKPTEMKNTPSLFNKNS